MSLGHLGLRGDGASTSTAAAIRDLSDDSDDDLSEYTPMLLDVWRLYFGEVPDGYTVTRDSGEWWVVEDGETDNTPAHE